MANNKLAQTLLAAETALALATKTSETAKALADAKVASDIAIALVGNDIGHIKADILEIKTLIKDMGVNFVPQEEHTELLKVVQDHEARIRSLEEDREPNKLTRKLVYGAAAFILVAVLSAIVYLVVKR
jgi:hypothetical protein